MKHNCSEKSVIGKLMILIGLFVAAPLIILPWYPQDVKYVWEFVIPGGGSALLGVICCLIKAKKPGPSVVGWKSSMGRSSLTVLFAWSWGVIIGAIPFVLGNQLTVVQALFEAVSGWTTTGLSTIDVSKTTPIYLFHRSFMQYCGGLGFIMVMILFISNKHAMNLYSAEGHPDKIMPNIKKTAQAIFIIYNVCLVLGSIAYRIAGMTWFDSICHCMCSLSTGGFSTKLRSIGEYNSLPIEIITIVLMLIGTTNFAALILLATGKFKAFFRVSEVKFMFLVLLVLVPPTAFSLARGLNISLGEGLRKASFDIVSAMSTTGYSTMSYAEWPQFAIGVLIIAQVMGGGIGSTAGGVKLSRVYILFRMLWLNIQKRLHPSRSVRAPYYWRANVKEPIDKELEDDTTGFFLGYIVLLVVGTLALSVAADCTLTEAMFDMSSSLSTVGLSIGITGPATCNAALIIEMIGMFLGRLEIFIVLIGITFGFGMLKSWLHKLFVRK